MPTVFVRNTDYNYHKLKPVIFEIMESAAGGVIQKNSRVVIKPNLLAPATPDEAVVTHPLIIKAVVEYLLDKGAKPQISDSPGSGSITKVLTKSGISNVLEGLNVEYKEFKKTISIDIGKPFKKIEIAEDAINADVLINLPKLKTHTQMLLTLGVKNLFGCIVGLKKPEWHLRAGVDREMFAGLLVKIHQVVNPTITILDGILAMEGQGPGKSGTPRKLGVVMGGKDSLAVDIVVCRMLGIKPDDLLTNKIAVEQELIKTDEILVDGNLPELKDFKFPEITPLVFGPKRIHGFMRKHLVQRPVCDNSACKMCGKCWNYCPARAIKPGGIKIQFDYEKCIRCYCCTEVCPYGALSVYETIIGKITRKLLKIK